MKLLMHGIAKIAHVCFPSLSASCANASLLDHSPIACTLKADQVHEPIMASHTSKDAV